MLKICLFGCVKCVYWREPSKIGESSNSHKIRKDIQKGSVEDFMLLGIQKQVC